MRPVKSPELADPRVLVAFASRFGTTGEVAEAIAETLRCRGASVDVRRAGDVADVAGYDAIIVGAAINYDTWMSDARAFVARHESALSHVPVAYFFTCGTLFEDSVAARTKAQRYAEKLEQVSDRVAPVSIGQFAGALDYSRMNRPTRFVLKIPFALMGVQEGDRRDFGAIRSWSESVLPQLLSPSALGSHGAARVWIV